jgi:hypothetical protein
MSLDQPVTSFDVASGESRGGRYTLYPNRLVFAGGDIMETVPLAHLASVRVAFERDARKLNWAIGLLAVAFLLAVLSSPLQSWMTSLSAKVSTNPGESLEGVLLASFSAIGHLARLFVPTALIFAAGAAALVFFFWVGQTTLTLAFAATERLCVVRGRDSRLVEFAELLAEQLAARKG